MKCLHTDDVALNFAWVVLRQGNGGIVNETSQQDTEHYCQESKLGDQPRFLPPISTHRQLPS